jgi:dTDP-4-dehydrorhamnose 3,5-epimerase
MIIKETELKDAKILQPVVHADDRGFFQTYLKNEDYIKLGFIPVEFNESYTKKKGTFRGIHFQLMPYSQAKIVRVSRGAVYDIIVDLRKDSPTYLKSIKVLLSDENHTLLYVPRGFGHAFVTLTDDVIFNYIVDNTYNKEFDRSINYNDPDLNLDLKDIEINFLSNKDSAAPRLVESDYNF